MAEDALNELVWSRDELSSEGEGLIYRVRNLMWRATAAPSSPHPRFFHRLAAIVEEEDSRFEKDAGCTASVSITCQLPQDFERFTNVIRDNDDSFELLSSQFSVEPRHSTTVKAAGARRLPGCSSHGMHSDALNGTVLPTVKQLVAEDAPQSTANVFSSKRPRPKKVEGPVSTDMDILKTCSLGLLVLALETGGINVEGVWATDVFGKLIHHLGLYMLNEVEDGGNRENSMVKGDGKRTENMYNGKKDFKKRSESGEMNFYNDRVRSSRESDATAEVRALLHFILERAEPVDVMDFSAPGKKDERAEEIEEKIARAFFEPVKFAGGAATHLASASALKTSEVFIKEGGKTLTWNEPISLLRILGEGNSSPWFREVEATLYLDTLIGHIPYVSSSSGSDSSGHHASVQEDWVMISRNFLFGPGNFRIARVVADDYSYSGSGWFYHEDYLITCAHVTNNIQGRQRDILVQLPDRTLLDVEVVYSCAHDKLLISYKMDISILRLKQIRWAPIATTVSNLPIATVEAGELIWTAKCVTAGVLGTEVQNVLQNMINSGRVESNSQIRTTVNARADLGFSGGPVLDKNLKIIGMIQGGYGVDSKTVAIIPIEEVAKLIAILSVKEPTLPGFSIPMQVDNRTIPY